MAELPEIRLLISVEDGPMIRIVVAPRPDGGAVVTSEGGYGSTGPRDLGDASLAELRRLVSVARTPVAAAAAFHGIGSGHEIAIGRWPLSITYRWLQVCPAEWEDIGAIAAEVARLGGRSLRG